MALWRFLFVAALALGSLVPHCAVAGPVPVAAHHAGMAHDRQPPAKAHVSDACIGCATPVRLTFFTAPSPMRAIDIHVAVVSTLPTYDAALDPPPPRNGL